MPRNRLTNNGSLAALGSDLAGAAQLKPGVTAVTGADGAKGVRLPSGAGGGVTVLVVNTVDSQNLLIYPASGGVINYGSASAAYTLAGRKHALLVSVAADQWYTVLTA